MHWQRLGHRSGNHFWRNLNPRQTAESSMLHQAWNNNPLMKLYPVLHHLATKSPKHLLYGNLKQDSPTQIAQLHQRKTGQQRCISKGESGYSNNRKNSEGPTVNILWSAGLFATLIDWLLEESPSYLTAPDPINAALTFAWRARIRRRDTNAAIKALTFVEDEISKGTLPNVKDQKINIRFEDLKADVNLAKASQSFSNEERQEHVHIAFTSYLQALKLIELTLDDGFEKRVLTNVLRLKTAEAQRKRGNLIEAVNMCRKAVDLAYKDRQKESDGNELVINGNLMYIVCQERLAVALLAGVPDKPHGAEGLDHLSKDDARKLKEATSLINAIVQQGEKAKFPVDSVPRLHMTMFFREVAQSLMVIGDFESAFKVLEVAENNLEEYDLKALNEEALHFLPEVFCIEAECLMAMKKKEKARLKAKQAMQIVQVRPEFWRASNEEYRSKVIKFYDEINFSVRGIAKPVKFSDYTEAHRI